MKVQLMYTSIFFFIQHVSIIIKKNLQIQLQRLRSNDIQTENNNYPNNLLALLCVCF